MKTLIILFLVLFASLSSNAQDPQLFENTWYLQKVEIEDIDYFPPGINGEGVIIPLEFNEFPEELGTSICNAISVSCTYSSSESLITTLGDWTIFGFECVNNENLVFANLYYNSIWHLDVNQNFDISYLIEDDGDNKKLTITNNEGNQAIYGNVLLAKPDFENFSFEIYPNPVKNMVSIEKSKEITIIKIEIYDALGKMVLELINPNNQFNLSSVSKGLLFIKFETEKGVFIKKLVKR